MALWFPVARFSPRRERAADDGRRFAGSIAMNVVARAVLRAEAAAHELADDAHLVRRKAEPARDLVADAEDELRRDVDVDGVAAPLAHRLMRLERAVEDGLRPVLGLDHDVRLGERAVDVAALVAARLADELALVRGLFGVEQRFLDVPLDVDQLDRRPCLLDRVGGDGSDRLALVAGLVGQRVDVFGAHCAPYPGSGERSLERSPLRACGDRKDRVQRPSLAGRELARARMGPVTRYRRPRSGAAAARGRSARHSSMRRRARHRLRGLLDRDAYARIGAAAAQVARHRMPDLVRARARVALDER